MSVEKHKFYNTVNCGCDLWLWWFVYFMLLISRSLYEYVYSVLHKTKALVSQIFNGIISYNINIYILITA